MDVIQNHHGIMKLFCFNCYERVKHNVFWGIPHWAPASMAPELMAPKLFHTGHLSIFFAGAQCGIVYSLKFYSTLGY